ncbi:MAG TPA: hypothetical protein VHL80_16465 [Polyangia bacterium]|nr:hypothetical protein [Polyangia bacterium]
MRSKFLASTAIASVGVLGVFVSLAHAAPAKAKAAAAKSKAKDADAAKPLELHADDKSMKKQTQWEDKVMGPDSTRKELEKIARARAINEKAAQEKERQAALEPAPRPASTPASRKNDKAEISLIQPEKNEPARAHEISPQLETAAAQKPVAAAKPADDKFIDKLLREEDSPSKRRASTASDKDLEALLSGAKEKPAGKKKGDSVDEMLKMADKGPAMPAPRAQSSGLPEWAKQPEISPTPAPAPPPAPVAVKPAKPSPGVIQVVQGAAGNGPAVIAPERPSPVAARSSRRGGKAAAPAPANWSDPFADKRPVASTQALKKEAASRPTATTDTSWNDPFASEPETRKTGRRAAPTSTSASPATPAAAPKKTEPAARPAGNGAWKDPFTQTTSEPARASVAMRDLGKNESSKWEIATRHPARASASEARPASGWGVLKKRSR